MKHGQSIISSRRSAPPPTTRPRVLVVVRDDGSVEVYAERGAVQVKVVHPLKVSTIEGERLADEFVELTLPKPWRDIYVAPNLLVGGNTKFCLTPAEEADRRWTLSLIKGIRDGKQRSGTQCRLRAKGEHDGNGGRRAERRDAIGAQDRPGRSG